MGPNVWVLIPILGMTIPLFAIWIKHREQLEKHRISVAYQQPAAEAAPAQSAQLKALEERVRVLERIVTDGGYSVAAQIEALRDTDQGSGVPLAMPARETV